MGDNMIEFLQMKTRWRNPIAEIPLPDMQECVMPSPRPKNSLGGHIGQEPFKKLAQIHLDNRGDFPHVLLHGPPGFGKTTLSKKLANCIGGRFRYYIGKDLNLARMHELIVSLKKNDVIFIDEIHSIDPGGAEVFYDVVQDFAYIGKPVPHFTLIGATTDPARVPKPLRERMWSYRMVPYSIREIADIVELHYPKISSTGAMECAIRALGVPRLAVQRAKHVVAAQGRMSLDEVFELQGIDGIGLESEHRKILNLLKTSERPMGLKEIAFVMDMNPRDYETLYEVHLLKLGFVSRTLRGRVITPRGIAYLGGKGEKHWLSEENTELT